MNKRPLTPTERPKAAGPLSTRRVHRHHLNERRLLGLIAARPNDWIWGAKQPPTINATLEVLASKTRTSHVSARNVWDEMWDENSPCHREEPNTHVPGLPLVTPTGMQ